VTCNDPLGLESSLITDNQIVAMNAYNDDNLRYGAQLARLNGKTGYRANQGKVQNAWITIDFQKPVVITEIRTQGYGDSNTSEWVTKFHLFYAVNSVEDYKYFRGTDGAQMVSETVKQIECFLYIGVKTENSVFFLEDQK
jgi:hypothetical protein